MAHFPAWLPAPAAAHANRLLDSGGLDDESKARLLALTSDPSMERVWKTLCRAAPDDNALVEFLDEVRLHYTVMGPWSAWPELSPAQQRKSFRAIAKHAAALLQELERLAGSNGHAESGLAAVESALRRAAGVSASQSWNTVLMRALSLSEDLEQTEEVSLVGQLRALVEAAQMAAATPPPPGPRKQKAENALRTAYVQDLSSFVRRRFGAPFHQAIRVRLATANLFRVVAEGRLPYSANLVTDMMQEIEIHAREAEIAASREIMPPLERLQPQLGRTVPPILSDAKTRALDLAKGEVSLFVHRLAAAQSSASPRPGVNIHVEGNVGAMMTGDYSTANIVQHFGAEEKEIVERALVAVREYVTAQGGNIPELTEIVDEAEVEANKPKPNLARLKGLLSGVATTIQTTAAAQPAYALIKDALAVLGIGG